MGEEPTPRVMHVFRLGPMPSSGGATTFAYVGLAEGGEPLIHEAPTDRGGLERIRGQSLGLPLSCEPALAEAGQALGLESAPLPPDVLRRRAVLAYEMASGVQHGASKLEAMAAFLRGAGAFWAAKSWEVVGPEERLRVAFVEGHAEVDAELSVVGGDGTRLPGVALCDAGPALQELAGLAGEARAEAALRLANLTVDLEREPAWAAEVLEEGYGLPRLPVAARKRGAGISPMVTQDLLVAAALLEAIAAWTGLEEEGAVGEGKAEAAGMRVVARVRASDAIAPPAAEGLTKVEAKAVEAAPPPEPAPAAAPAASEAASEPGPAAPPPVPDTSPATAVADAAPATAEPTPAAATPATAPPPPAAAAPVAPPAAPAAPPEAAPPRPAPETAAAPVRPSPAATQGGSPGWLARVWRSLRGERAARPAAPRRPPAARTAPRPATRPAPAAARPPAPVPAPAAPDADPFAPFARALHVELPPEPAPLSAADEAALAELAGRLVEAAKAATAELVSFPAVALEIVDRVHDPRADARGVAGFIARDPALAADVVSVANSAAFRGVSEIESVHEAVARLGLTEVGRVASAVAARKVLDPAGSGSAGATELFLRAVAVASAAAGAALRQRGARTDHVWLGGLLHDVGRVLARQLLARLASQPGEHLTPVALGERIVEHVHVEVGLAALRQWALPGYLLEICAHHHDATVAAEAVDLHLVRLTSALASLGEPLVAGRAARELVQSAAALRLDAAAVRALATDLKDAHGRARALVR